MSQIEQRISVKGTRAQVYKALTVASEFATWSGAEATIDATEGGAFVCFGTYITGRNVELVADQRIVQAWRVFDWPEGVYSIIRFELSEQAGQTEIAFTQDGAPDDAVSHLDPGWHKKYWEPLKAHLER